MSVTKLTFNGVSVFQVLDDIRRGVETHLNKGDSLTLSGTHLTKGDLLSTVNTLQQPSLAVEVARRDYEAALRTRDAAAPAIGVFLARFESAVSSKISADPHVMAKYGIPAPKAKRTLTVEEKQAQVAKMLATRKARGTLGRRQRRKVKGAVQVDAGTPLSAPESKPVATSPLALVPVATSGAAH
jgi:hypothetical protein